MYALVGSGLFEWRLFFNCEKAEAIFFLHNPNALVTRSSSVEFVTAKFRLYLKQESFVQFNMLTAERILDPLSVVMRTCWGSLSPHDFSVLHKPSAVLGQLLLKSH